MTTLLEHREWLRRLARHLVAPAEAAEDVLQETWVVALRRPPREPGRARAWLGRVLINSFRRYVRSERRRREREQAVAELRGDSEAPAAAGLEQLRLQRRLISLVDALEEPFRLTIVMRYFEGRSAAQMARSLGVPEGTIRWRTHEALSRLRRALDQQSGGDRRAWIAHFAPVAAVQSTARLGRPIVWLAGSTLVLALAGAGALMRSPERSREERRVAFVPEAGSSRRASSSRPRMMAAALALAGRSVPPAEQLARARNLWAQACPGAPVGGLCAVATPPPSTACAQAAEAGPRWAGVPRRQAGREQALGLWKDVSARSPLPYELRIQADLALAEDNLEALLAIEPLSDIVLPPGDRVRLEEQHGRLQEFMVRVGQHRRDAEWAFERLSGAADELPEVHMARARLGQTIAESARLKLAMAIPDGLPGLNRWGKDEQAAFCRAIAQNARKLFEKARRQFRYCAERARTLNPEAAELCSRELARLPPEAPPS